MKRIISLMLCFSVIATTLALGAVAAEPFTVSGGDMGIAEKISAEEFADGVSDLIESTQNDPSIVLSDSEGAFASSRLIVKSAHNINLKNAISVVNGFDDLWVLQYESPEKAQNAFNYYNGRPGIQFVEPDRKVKLCADNNSIVTQAVDFKYISWGSSHIGIDRLNDSLKRNPELIKNKIYVAVVDTGVNHKHPYLEGRVEPTRINTSGVGERNSSMDDNGHGTQVAGVIADATLDNIVIRPYKVLDTYGVGTLISLAAGINCAIKDGVDVINVSLGFYEDSDVLKNAIDRAHENDIIVTAAAGNDNTDNPFYPSSYDSVIRVAATNSQNVIANFSNYSNIDIAAPGVSIMTTNFNGGYLTTSGTSFASPLVAAVAAVILSIAPESSPEDIQNQLENLSMQVFEPDAKKRFGAGILMAPTIEEINQKPRTDAPVFSHETALYRDEIEISITCTTPDSIIYYTTDETIPRKSNPSAKIYSEPLLINKTTKILAVAYADNYFRSSISDFSAIIAPYASDEELTIDSNGVITAYSGTATSFSIPEKVNGITVTKLGDGVLKNKGLTELLLPPTLTEIGKESIAENPNLKSVFAYGLKSIGERAFYNCIWLKNIFFGEIEHIGEYAFYNVCSKAFELRESSFSLQLNNTASIPEGAFMNSALSEAKIDVDVTVGKNAFTNCNALVNIDFSSLKHINDGAFKNLRSLREVRIEKLENIPKGLFTTCENLQHIHLPDAVTIESNAFENCVSLELIEIPNAEIINSNAFSGCDSLTVLNLDSLISFNEEAYLSDTATPFPKNLQIFYAPQLKRTTFMMFSKCPDIYMIYLNSATEFSKNTFYGCKSIFYIDMRSATELDSYVFNECSAEAIDLRSLVSTKSLPNNSGIILSNEFVESQQTATNLTVYGTPDTYIERYCNHKGYTFVGIPLVINEIPEYITENSEMIILNAVGFDLEYQWYWNSKKSTEGGTAIKDATERSYTFTQEDSAPYYYCKITHHDTDRDIIIFTDIITKDSTPADYTEYNKAVEAAASIDRSQYINIEILDNALAVNVSDRYSCEQDIVDAQTQAIYDAINSLVGKGVQSLNIFLSKRTDTL
ncbi:MAG: leucine-rich repeat protein [Clostridia bacterium]|nr:leucine-rich repeat protein [Clostridia bacterium]